MLSWKESVTYEKMYSLVKPAVFNDKKLGFNFQVKDENTQKKIS